jgi:hypothetical protein
MEMRAAARNLALVFASDLLLGGAGSGEEGADCFFRRFFYRKGLTGCRRKAKHADVCADLRLNAWASATSKCLSAH